MIDPEGPSGRALASLDDAQVDFLRRLPKAELHAHLNGSIPLPVLSELAQDRIARSGNEGDNELVRKGLEVLARKEGVSLETILSFFDLFPAVYALTDAPDAISTVTSAVLESFLSSSDPQTPSQCAFLELRTTPRATPSMTRRQYLAAVLSVMKGYEGKATLIVSVDRNLPVNEAEECLSLAIEFKASGHPVVGVDICGHPGKGDMKELESAFRRAKAVGLKVTLHIAETPDNPPEETMLLLSWLPDRLGHATFLDQEAIEFVAKHRIPIELCLSSNLLCKSVPDLASHHITPWLARDHPVVICTDDVLPFRTDLVGEYALLLAAPPLGLGLSRQTVEKIAQDSFGVRF